jgi:RNA polymerase-associated protein LEO1
MSSSEDEAVRRPGRGGRAYDDDVSDEDNANISAPENDQADDNDDKDLFGSGSEPDLDECARFSIEQERSIS